MNKCCEDCCWWQKKTATKNGWMGECRRHPPIVFATMESAIMGGVVSGDSKTEWPSVDSHAWCGEFKKNV